ncbi:NHL repeat-containing protein [Mucilaginibacter agri]|uniref:SMP-30/Gluconolactonase/LRE-like region domain-containing protein n=1 Tax=Mucilaginibacter agri TaxID=2695265 RepID=A0A966DV89_9SPHI|nr:hypothetical protein [Mucilaginibacter agri]NCD71231.1 hypothetical protein [Mucilaginibacter agri]
MKKVVISAFAILLAITACKKTENVQPTADPVVTDDMEATNAVLGVSEPAYTVRTIAGVFEPTVSDPHLRNGPGPQAKFYKPHGIAIADDGSIYIADFLNDAIRKITIQNNVYSVPFSSNPQSGGLLPEAVEIGSDGTIYIVSTGYGIRIYNKERGIDIVSRIGNADSNLDIEKDNKGVFWFVNDNSLGKITNTTIQRNVVNFSDLLVPNTNDRLRGVGVAPNGVKYVSCTTRLFKVAADGSVTRMLPNEKFTYISGISVSTDGSTIYIADGNVIKRIVNNTVTTIAGPNGGSGKDGIGLAADVVAANLALSNSGKALFVTDTRNTIRKIILP